MKILLYKAFIRNWKSKILSLFAAIVLSVYVHFLQSGIVFMQVPLVYIGLPSNLTFLQTPENHIELKLRSIKKIPWDTDTIQLKAEVDLSLASPSIHKYSVSLEKSILPNYVSIVHFPKVLELTLDYKKDKRVPVKLTFLEKGVTEKDILNLIMKPEFITIQGAAQILNKITHLKTFPIVLDKNRMHYVLDEIKIKNIYNNHVVITEKLVSASFLFRGAYGVVSKGFNISKLHIIGLSSDLLLEQPDYDIQFFLEGDQRYINNISEGNLSIGINLATYTLNETNGIIEPFDKVPLSSIELLDNVLKDHVVFVGLIKEQQNRSLSLRIKNSAY